jgi:hypothetical protein
MVSMTVGTETFAKRKRHSEHPFRGGGRLPEIAPMPVTGHTITVKRSDVLDLNITIDQAIQFTVSCGVVCPPLALEEAIEAKTVADKKA